MATKIICDKCNKELGKDRYRCAISKVGIDNELPLDLCEECYKGIMEYIRAREHSTLTGLTWAVR